jgi:RND family efflux transporter MFP subunit
MKARRILSTLVGVSFLGAALAFGFWPASQKPEPVSMPENIVRVEPVTFSVVQRQVLLSGITRAARRAVLSFTVSARMERRVVDIGDHVIRGQVLAILDVTQFDNAVDTAQAKRKELEIQLAQAERDRRRLAILVKDKVVPIKDYERVSATADALAAALQSTTAGLAEARRVRMEAELHAPFSGTVTAVHLESGEWAVPGLPVIEISGDGNIELEVDLPETVIGHLTKGQQVDVVLPFADDRHVSGRVDRLARAALSSGRLFPMVVVLDQADGVVPGMTAQLNLVVRTPPRLLVPVGAVVNPGASRPSVFVVQNDTAREVSVQLGGFHGDQVVVSGDLGEGDRVVVAGHTALATGKRVVVR